MHLYITEREIEKMKKISCLLVLFLAVSAVVVSLAECAPFKYESKSKRDPFVPLIGADKTVATGLENATSVKDLNLEGIANGPKGKNIAILNGEMVKEGDKFGILEIKSISQKAVNVSIDKTDYTLNLSEEGAVKSEKRDNGKI